MDGNGNTILPTCSWCDCDKRNSDQPNNVEWLWNQGEIASTNLNDVSNLNRALGVDARTIAWMRKEDRTDAYGRADGLSTDSMKSAFADGQPLAAGDNFFVMSTYNVQRGYGYPTPSRGWQGAGDSIDREFVRNVCDFGVSTFILVADHDAMIWSPSIALALADPLANDNNGVDAGVSQAVCSSSQVTSVQGRAGGMSLTKDGGIARVVTMPTSYEAGHTISMRAPAGAALLADIMRWYMGSPH